MKSSNYPPLQKANIKLARGWLPAYSYTYLLKAMSASKLLPSSQSSLHLHFLALLSDFEIETHEIIQLSITTGGKHKNQQGGHYQRILGHIYSRL
jgi:hypothetical protein